MSTPKQNFEYKFTLTPNMFDCQKRLNLYALQDMFQTISGMHASELDCGMNWCEENNLGWIVAKTEIIRFAEPILYEVVSAKTWIHPTDGISYFREYTLESDSGKIYFRAIVLWVLVNFKNFMLTRGGIGYKGVEFNAKLYFEPKMRRITNVKKDALLLGSKVIEYSDLDTFMHVNNTKYFKFLTDLLGDEFFEYNDVLIQYLHQAKLDEVLDFYLLEEVNTKKISAYAGEEIIFSAELVKERNEQ